MKLQLLSLCIVLGMSVAAHAQASNASTDSSTGTSDTMAPAAPTDSMSGSSDTATSGAPSAPTSEMVVPQAPAVPTDTLAPSMPMDSTSNSGTMPAE